MQYSKLPIDIQWQIFILQERGLIIDDIPSAKHTLEHIGYFRFTGYCKYFQSSDDIFRTGTTFGTVLDTYVFDRKLRLLTLDAIEKIEVSFKSNISNYMSLIGWPFWYADTSLFDLTELWKEDIYNTLLEHITKVKSKSSSVFVNAYNSKYSEEVYLPSWMLFEEFTLWEVSNIYRILLKNHRQTIANVYWTYNIDLSKWLQLLVNMRNISAHHARLWNRKYIWKPRVDDVIFRDRFQLYDNQFGISEVLPNYYNATLIIHYLLNIINKNFSWIDDLEWLFYEFPEVPKISMWFYEEAFDRIRNM
jgi:abortive infection bacteriophage resistance protein